MIVKKTDIIKLIKKELFETRFIMSGGDSESKNSEESLQAEKMSKFFGKDLKFKKFDSNEEFKDYLFDIAGPDMFISFIYPYERDETTGEEKVPSFSLNPNANFNTPHGLYFYPFDKENAEKFIHYGAPTDATFAVDRPYFHLVKIDITNPEVLIFKRNGETNKNISPENFKKDLKEMIRIHLHFFDKKRSIQEIYDKLTEKFNDYNELIIYGLNKEKNNNKELDSQRKADLFINKISNNNYYKLYKYAYYLSSKNIDSLSINSELFALLLNRINIKCVIDQNMSIIHPNEPEQTHILTFGENKSFYEYIGTFKNKIEKSEEEILSYLNLIKDNKKKLKYIMTSKSKLFNPKYSHAFFEIIINTNNKEIISKFLEYFNQTILQDLYNFNQGITREELIKKLIPDHFHNFLKQHFFSFYLENLADYSDENNILRLEHLEETSSYSFKEDIARDFIKKYPDLEILDFLEKVSMQGHDEACKQIIRYLPIYHEIYRNKDSTFHLLKIAPAESIFHILKLNKSFVKKDFIEKLVDENINDLKKIESIYDYVKNVMDRYDQKYILDYIKSKNRIYESIKKLKLLIKKQINYLN